jgi:hypothetical protein
MADFVERCACWFAKVLDTWRSDARLAVTGNTHGYATLAVQCWNLVTLCLLARSTAEVRKHPIGSRWELGDSF